MASTRRRLSSASIQCVIVLDTRKQDYVKSAPIRLLPAYNKERYTSVLTSYLLLTAASLSRAGASSFAGAMRGCQWQ